VNKLPGIGLLLFAATGIGMVGTLRMVMAAQSWAHLCPSGFEADPNQSFRNVLVYNHVECVKIGISNPTHAEEVKYVMLSLEERHKLCVAEGVAGAPGWADMCQPVS
jgi:hypothetical protein